MADRLFRVSCVHCGQVIVIVSRINDGILDRLHMHLQACCPSQLVETAPGIAVMLAHVQVEPTS